ncbi:MAG: hypothetical protein ACSHWW_04985 [Nonlabens sp.]|uniref:hypothetical protein n=1 Tax=Nonlabens sp. TaxID=1888209 RepID=UPI003EF4E6BF
MNNFLSLSLAVLVQRPQNGPPVPKMDAPPPPVGDVPVDGNLWILILFAVILGAAAVYRNRQKAL